LYQPLPLSTKLVALIFFFTLFALQEGHSVIGSSENFCRASNWWPQSGQPYS
jgi:hypothetical protein